MPIRPADDFWQNEAGPPFLYPGLNTRDTEILDYAEALSSETEANEQTGNYTLVLADKGKVVEVNSASSSTVTVPADASVDFPIGTYIEIDQIGAGQVTVQADAGVTVLSSGGLLSLRAQYSTAVLRKRAADSWLLVGDLA